ncbi:hypothetical protein [Streptomyces sp. NPDC088775]|uniref:hypothetical protein n=1 Tax=Streptomyces sp. NPDC088775 TaxID=3365896 RepID=UPI0038270977
MAVQLSEIRTCDWHAVLPDPAKVEATAERTTPKGTINDLCGACALLFDLTVPRLDEILLFVQPDTLEQLFRVGRTAPDEKKTHRSPAQLAIPGEATPSLPAPKTPTSPRERAARGLWKEGTVQILCPLPHRAGSPRKYWVDLRNRTGHAHSHKKDDGTPYGGPDIAFELQPGVEFTRFCTEHEVCAKHGGYGFLDELALNAHINKSRDWPKASEETRDAAETRLRRQAA